jgi:hypothetical protein
VFSPLTPAPLSPPAALGPLRVPTTPIPESLSPESYRYELIPNSAPPIHVHGARVLLWSLKCGGAGGGGTDGGGRTSQDAVLPRLKPESAMIAVLPVLHEIIPHGWTRVWLFERDATISSTYGENPLGAALFRERLWTFAKDPSSPVSLILGPALRAVGIGWGLHLQGRGYLESRYYREMEAPLDSCWVLDAMVGDGGRSIAGMHLTRPRSARPFQVDDIQRLDRLRPWLAHAFRRSPSGNARDEDEALISATGALVRNGQVLVTPGARLLHQTTGVEHLLRILAGDPGNYTRYVPVSGSLRAPVLKLLRQITGATNGTSQYAAAHADFDRLWRSHARGQMAHACGRAYGRRQGSEILSHIGDDRSARAPHCPCGSRAAGKRRHAGPDESRHSARVGQNETDDRG